MTGCCVSEHLSDAERRAVTNERIGYIAPISRRLTEERTSLESKIIPV